MENEKNTNKIIREKDTKKFIRGFYLIDEKGNETKGLEFYNDGHYKLRLNAGYLASNYFHSQEDKIEFIETILQNSLKRE